jgi:hypothetical protein
MERQKMISLSAFIGIAILTIFAGQAAAEATVHQESVKKEIEAIGATGSSPAAVAELIVDSKLKDFALSNFPKCIETGTLEAPNQTRISGI